MKFKATLELVGKTATGFVVPATIVERLGAGKRPPVRVTIRDYTYRTTIAVMGREYMIGVAAEHRAKAGVRANDTLTVDVALDTEPRVVEVPPDLAAALEHDPAARRAFEKLSYTHRKEHVSALEDAKKPETRARRLAKTLEMLRVPR